jgi:hypothetical protein
MANKHLNQTAPQAKPQHPPQDTAPQPLALPTMDKVMMTRAIASTQAGITNIDRLMEKRTAILTQRFDNQLAQSDADFEAHVKGSMPGDAVMDFLQPEDDWSNLDAMFDRLLMPEQNPIDEPEPPAGEQTIDAPALAVVG